MADTLRSTPLKGCRIIVTRPQRYADRLVAKLNNLGAKAKAIPLIRIEPSPHLREIGTSIAQLHAYDWIIFTSPSGVHAFWRCVDDISAKELPKICAVGPGTAAVLAEYGLHADFLPPTALGAAIPASLDEHLRQTSSAQGLRGMRLLLPRSNQADPALITALTDLGAHVTSVTAYLTVPDVTGARKTVEAILNNEVDVLYFASPSAVRAFHARAQDGDTPRFDLCADISCVCIGPVTARALADANQHLGFRPDRIAVAAEPTAEAFVDRTSRLWNTMLEERTRRT